MFRKNFAMKMVSWSLLSPKEKLLLLISVLCALTIFGLMIFLLLQSMSLWIKILIELMLLVGVFLMLILMYLAMAKKFFRIEKKDEIGFQERKYLTAYLKEFET